MATVDSDFKIVILGDSISWGQGLYEHQKIHSLVAAELIQRGIAVDTVVKAHSGAIIGDHDLIANGEPLDGEVPVGSPTIYEQIHAILGMSRQDEAVNLVLLSGGVNDVDITHILNFLDYGLDQHLQDVFYRKIKLLIEHVCHSFPNAIIVLLGYYPFVSDVSECSIVLNVLKALAFSRPLLPNSIGAWVIEAFGVSLKWRLAERSFYFRNAAHKYIQEAIAHLVSMMPEERVFFADPQFKEENAIGAPETFLYGINPDLSPQDPADIVASREKVCEIEAGHGKLPNHVAMRCASVGHPNPAGARQYADVVLKCLHHAIPQLFNE